MGMCTTKFLNEELKLICCSMRNLALPIPWAHSRGIGGTQGRRTAGAQRRKGQKRPRTPHATYIYMPPPLARARS